MNLGQVVPGTLIHRMQDGEIPSVELRWLERYYSQVSLALFEPLGMTRA